MSELNEQELFEQCLALPPEERVQHLKTVCRNDPSLLRRVERLLSVHEQAESEETATAFPLPKNPSKIGPYKILDLLGEGGMGTVYLAEQTQPVQRRVALKLMKLGMDTAQVVARFEAERQALAVMDHHNIAKVLDGGSTPEGRPFFVMELVRGIPLIEYCDRGNMRTHQRLILFLSLCRAVQHAHQKGVIHRDLKPSNVLVTEEDGAPQPKVIDFGIAKALGQRLTDHTLVTQLGQLMGTPAYMSPEQAEASALDVDTRSDIYSLGVLLYELLVGALPVDPSVVGLRTFMSQLALRETDPPTPSAKLELLGDRWTDIAGQRRTDPWSLRKELKGDLDWVVMKAMEKDRSRRYETVSALAQDIERFLNDEPVLARPPQASYRLRKFVRRNRTAVVASALMLLALLIGSAGLTMGLIRATRAESEARREASTAQQVTDFLVDLFEVNNPGQDRANSITAREILDRGSERVRSRLQEEPLVKARLLDTMGRVYQNLGLYPEARPLLGSSLSLRRERLGEDHIEVAKSLNNLAWLLENQGEYDEAEEKYRQALEIRISHLGREHPDVATAINNLALLLYHRGDYEASEPLFRESLDLRQRLEGSSQSEVGDTQGNLALVLYQKGEYQEAERLFRQAIDSHRLSVGERDLKVATDLNNLAILLQAEGELDEADPLFQEALEIRREILGEVHPQISESLNNLAALSVRQGDLERGHQLFEEVVRLDRDLLGNDHPDLGISLNNLAGVLRKKGDYQPAKPLLAEAIDILERSLGKEHWLYFLARGNYGSCLAKLGEKEEAERQLLASFDGLKSTLGADHQRTSNAKKALAEFYTEIGNQSKASEYK